MKLKTKQLVAILFPFFVVFVFIPTELYYHNAAQWNDTFLLKIVATAGLVFGFFVSILVVSLSKAPGIDIGKIGFWFFLAGIYFLFSDVYSPLQLSQLDGSNLISDQPLFYTMIELVIFMVVAFMGLFFNKAKHYKYATFLSQMGIIAITFYFGFALISPTLENSVNTNSSQASVEERQDLPNVYHIVLDSMQTDYFLRALEETGYGDHFAGFTVFKNNISNYPYTQASTASYFTSTTYTGRDFKQWIEESDQGLFNVMKASGYELTVYGKAAVIKASSADEYISADEIFTRYSGRSHPLLKEFIRLWTARVLPNAVTNLALRLGGRVGDLTTKLFSTPHAGVPTTINDGIEPFTGAYVIQDAIQSEIDRPKKASYLYLHPILPHEPFVLDSGCNYTKPQGNVANQYIQQVECTIKLLTEFFDELKREGKYDDALIIIHGDHGNGWAGFIEDVDENGEYISSIGFNDLTPYRPEIHPWSKHHLESRSMALLMIKPPGAEAELAVSDAATQLLDLYPTILDFLEISPPLKMEGVSLTSCINDNRDCDDLNKRKRYFYYFTVGASYTKDVEELLVGINELGRPEFLSSHFNKVFYPVTPGDTISFSGKGTGNNYLKEGWSVQDESYVWTEGDKATLTVNIPDSEVESLLFRLNAFAYLGGNLPHQNVEVAINGRRVTTWQISEPGWYEVRIPESIVGNGNLEFVFTIGDPTAPCEVGESKDCRTLGIAVMKMQINAADE